MKKIIVFALVVLFYNCTIAQVYDIESNDGQTVTTCTADFYDNFSGDYSANINQVITFKSSSTINTHMKISFSVFDIDPSDTLFVYNGLNVNSPLIGKYNNSIPFYGIQNSIQSTITNTSGALTFRFVTNGNLQKAGWVASISCIKPCQKIIATLNTLLTSPQPENNHIDICFGNPVSFVAAVNFPENNSTYHQSTNNCTYKWYFGDNSTVASGLAVTHNYAVINGYNVILVITDSMGCTNNNVLGTRVRIASKPVTTIQPIEDMCSGNSKIINVGYNSNSVINIHPLYSQIVKNSFDSTMFIPDGPVCPPGVCSAAINVNNFPNGSIIQSASDILSICVNIEHSFSGDLGFSIKCPNNQSVNIDPNQHSGANGLGDWYEPDGTPACLASANIPGIGWNYCWSELYPNNGTLGSKKTTSSSFKIDSTNTIAHTNYYLPANPFSGLIGCPLNGTWSIEITDDWASDNGFVFNWSLELQAQLMSSNWTYDVKVDSVGFYGPYLTTLNDTTAIITPATNGFFNYIIYMVDDFGCVWDTSINLNVVKTPHPNLGADISLCYPDTVILNPGNIASTYSWQTPSGIKTTQAITTAAVYTGVNSPFNYVLTASNYNVSNTLSCSGKDSILVTVKPLPEIAFVINPAISPIAGCAPFTVSFTNESTPSNSTFLWNFGDGQTSIVESPIHTYSIGNYAISLKATTTEGCSKTWFSSPGLIISAPKPATPTITRNGNMLISNSTIGNQWYDSSAGIINFANSQYFIANQIGSYYVVVTKNGCSSNNSNIINIDYIGIPEQHSEQFNIQVLPNPFSDKTTFVYTLTKDENVELSIFDLSGKEMKKLVNEIQTKGKQLIIFNSTELSSGIYFYKLKTANEVLIGKIIHNR
ncbi:MAG: PKD domain-containing protein [Bacteroidales bacterium]